MALAEDGAPDGTADSATAVDAPVKAKAEKPAEPKHPAKKSKSHGHKAHAAAPAAKAHVAAADKDAAAAPKKVKKTASRAPSKKKTAKKSTAQGAPRAGGSDGKAPSRPCVTPAVTLDRGGLESESLALVTCTGAPLEKARKELSILARPWGAARPEPAPAAPARAAKKGKGSRAPADPTLLAPGVKLVDPGLVTRLFLIARKFPGKSLSVVSGYRPASRGSLHQSARAIDVRVTGVDDAELVAYCKTIPDTGCGYYPNSSFVHVDVRAPGTGSVSWIDASGPGDPPRYVTAWPEPERAKEAAKTPSGIDDHGDAPEATDAAPRADSDPSPSANRPPAAKSAADELYGSDDQKQ